MRTDPERVSGAMDRVVDAAVLIVLVACVIALSQIFSEAMSAT